MRRLSAVLVVWVLMELYVGADARAEAASPPPPKGETRALEEVMVQIGGRLCEYHRHDVEAALRRFAEVQEVQFLNQHGTVLVRYQSGTVSQEQLAAAVERALAMGWNCKAWIKGGG